MGKPAARLGDMHVCPMMTPGVPPIPHVGGPIGPPCSTNVITAKMPQARMSDMCLCAGFPGPPADPIVLGSTGVFVNKLMAARMGDTCGHGGTIILGAPTVLIGEVKGGGGGGGGGGAGVSSNDYAGGGVPMIEFTLGAVQAASLVAAAESGTPFCEVCFGKGAG